MKKAMFMTNSTPRWNVDAAANPKRVPAQLSTATTMPTSSRMVAMSRASQSTGLFMCTKGLASRPCRP
jgi:hypothetical protein